MSSIFELFSDLRRFLVQYPSSTAALVSLVVAILYPFVVKVLKFRARRGRPASPSQSTGGAALSAAGGGAPEMLPWWMYYVPLPLLLIIVNFRMFFFWLPVTRTGKTVMIKYVLYKLSFGGLVISSDLSRRLYSYVFSTGSQLVFVLGFVLLLAFWLHDRLCRSHPVLRKLGIDAYFFLYPALCIIFVFNICPVFFSLFLSMHRGTAQDIFKDFVFLDHYKALLHDKTFWISLKNTAWFAFGSVPLTIAVSLFIAMLLNRKIRGLSFYRTVYFLPVITSVAAISLVWRWVYHPQRGVLNYILRWFGLPGLDWLYEPRGIFDLASTALFGRQMSGMVHRLGDACLVPFSWVGAAVPVPFDWFFHDFLPGIASGPSLAITAVIFMSVWKGLGYNVIIFLAGLQNIPNELYEAARIDGAGIWSRFRNITWPLLSPTTYFVLIMSTISSFQVFAQIFMLYAGNATDGSRVVVYYLFEKGFQTFQFGYASALAYVLFMIIFFFTTIQRKFVGEKVHYD